MEQLRNLKRAYVCHTYYHVYVALLKECALFREKGKDAGKALFLLSNFSNDFEHLADRMNASALVGMAIPFEERGEEFFTVLKKWHRDRANVFLNLLQRMVYFRKQAKLLTPFVPVDLRNFDDVYVFCDSDPIGYYLNAYCIPYHALEDGLDCLKYYDTAHYDNRGHFKLKAELSAMNLIFIQNGYGKYCLDMEVNSLAALPNPLPEGKGREVSRLALADELTEAQKEELVKIFIPEAGELLAQIGQSASSQGQRSQPAPSSPEAEDSDPQGQRSQPLASSPEAEDSDPQGQRSQPAPSSPEARAPQPQTKQPPTALILTEPLCGLETRKRIFRDIVAEYCEGHVCVFKPHPRDTLDYSALFPHDIVLKGRFPMEVLNLLPVVFDRVVSVFTVPDAIRFAKEKIFLGEDFMDRYEDPAIHRQNEFI